MRLTLTDLLNMDADRNDEKSSNADKTSANIEGDETRASIGKQIDNLEESTRSTRNTLAPVSKLPTELLCQVFKYVDDDDDPISGFEFATGEETRAQRRWRKLCTITGVCRDWRQIALHCCPSLWTSLIFSGVGDPECVVEEMVTRSRASALSVKLISNNDYLTFVKLSPDIATKILDIGSLQELHLILGEDRLEKVIRGITLAATARKMQSLTIRQTYPGFGPAYPFLNTISNLLSTPMPHLRNLDIGDCRIQWNVLQPCVFHELIALRLSYLSKPPRDSFFNLLSCTPNLETLRLDSALPPFVAADSRERIKLARLTSCTIESSTISQCLDFQTHVSYPTSLAKLYFYTLSTNWNRQPELPARAFSLLSSCGITVDNPQRTHSCLLFEVTPTFKIVLWDDTYDDPPEGIPSVSDLAVSVDFSTQPQAEPHVSAVLDLLSISGLDMLSIRWGVEEDLQTHLNALVKFFKRHQDITLVHLTDGYTHLTPLLTALSCSADSECVPETSDGKETKKAFIPCLPRLTTLTLERSNLGFKPDRRSLLGLLARYRGAGTTIRKVTLLRCDGLDENFVEEVEKMVEEVDWDGYSEDEDECDSGEECGLCCEIHGPEFDCTDRASYHH